MTVSSSPRRRRSSSDKPLVPADQHCIVVVGDGGVGKSSITIQYIRGAENVFFDDYDPTIEDFYRRQVVIDEQTSRLEIVDTAGQEEFRVMADDWYRQGDAFLIVFSVTSRRSFEEADNMRAKIVQCHEGYVPPIVLVGNKVDLVDDRKVSYSEASALARQWGSSYCETSAKLDEGIDECFSTIVRKSRTSRVPKPAKRSIWSRIFSCCRKQK